MLDLVSSEKRLDWIKDKYGLQESIYICDSFVDIEIVKEIGFSISPNDADKRLKNHVDLILENDGGIEPYQSLSLYQTKLNLIFLN